MATFNVVDQNGRVVGQLTDTQINSDPQLVGRLQEQGFNVQGTATGPGSVGRNPSIDVTTQPVDAGFGSGNIEDDINIGDDGSGGNAQVSDPPPGELTREEILQAFSNGADRADSIQALTNLLVRQGIDANTANLQANATIQEIAAGRHNEFSAPSGGTNLEIDTTPERFVGDNAVSLEDIFQDTGRTAAFNQFLRNRFGDQTTGTFRDVFSGLRQPFADAFNVNRLLDPQQRATGRFSDFLSGVGSQGIPGVSQAQLGQVADLLGEDPQTSSRNLSDVQRSIIESFRAPGSQLSQFNLATNARERALPFDLRGSFRNVARRQFDDILARQGTDPNFQFLPFLANRDFELFR
jgi:hypothetical protein